MFDTASLALNKADMGKFVGRIQELKSFAVDISGHDRALVLVSGTRGVGKTSFINVVGYALGFSPKFLTQHMPIALPKLVPCYRTVQLETSDDTKMALFKSLANIVFSAKQFAFDRNLKLPPRLEKINHWTADVVLSSPSASVNIAGFGVGGGVQQQHKNIIEVPSNTLQHMLEESVGLIKKHFKVDGVLLNINNVELLPEKRVCQIFNELRDYLFVMKGVWTVVVGQTGLYSLLYQQATRVAEFVNGQGTQLNPLSQEDVIRVLKQRRQLYAVKPQKVPPLPVAEKMVREIYSHSDGEVRLVFKSCDDIMRVVFKDTPNVSHIKAELAKKALKYALHEQLALSRLKPKELELIRYVLKHGSIRPKEYERLKLKSAVDFTNKATPLLEKNFLKKEASGNIAEYKAAGRVHLAQHMGIKF